ncbi:MAG: recombinase RecA [Chlamydiota bacterium]
MKEQRNEGKQQALERVVQHIKQQFGEGAIMSLGARMVQEKVPVISTGALTLDLALGIGGVPRGRIVEIYGPESSGKSTLATHIVANAQKQGGVAAYIDAEHAMDPDYARHLGVDTKELLIAQPTSGEEALNIAEMLARSNAVDVIVIDSVAALVPKNELDGEIGDLHVGLQARMMSQALRKLTSSLARSNTCAIFINQIREKIGVLFGNPETTTGGRALKFYASVRIEIRSKKMKGETKEGLLDSSGIKGVHATAKVVKNKMAPPFGVAKFDIFFSEGISRAGSLLDVGVELGIIEKKGAWFAFEGTRLGQGREAVIQEIKKQPALQNTLEEQIYAKLRSAQEKECTLASSADVK